MNDDEATLSGQELARLHWHKGRRNPGYHGTEYAREMRRLKKNEDTITDALASAFMIGIIVFVASKVLDFVAANPLLKMAIGLVLLVGGLYLLYRFVRALYHFICCAAEMSATAWWHLLRAWGTLRRAIGAVRRTGTSLRAAWRNSRCRSVSRYGFPDIYFGSGQGRRGPVLVFMPGDRTMTLEADEWIDAGQSPRSKQLTVARGIRHNLSTKGQLQYQVVFESMPGGLNASRYAVSVEGHGLMPQRFTDPQIALAASRWYALVLTVHGHLPKGYLYDPVRHRV